jgi:pimeloyl-ACP methyl ester carboxylesterase
MIGSRTRRLSAGCIALVMIGLVASWTVGSHLSRGEQWHVPAARPPAQDVRLRAVDGLSIAATYRPGRDSTAPAVLLLHAKGQSRQSMASRAEWLASLGYASLAIDFRGHGESDLAPRTNGYTEARDARAALTWLKARQRGAPVAIVGISLGGAASLIGEQGPLPADALILQAVYPDLRRAIHNRIAQRAPDGVASLLEPLLSLQTLPRIGVWPSRISPRHALAAFNGPVLVMGSTGDESTPPRETHALFSAVSGDRSLWLADAGDHAAMCDLDGTTYRAILVAFLRRTIGAPGRRRTEKGSISDNG